MEAREKGGEDGIAAVKTGPPILTRSKCGEPHFGSGAFDLPASHSPQRGLLEGLAALL